MKKIETNYKTTVEFYDLDPMNVVWHGNYIKYLEAARCDMLEKLGYTYDDMRFEKSAYPVAKMELKFIKSAAFKQKLNVKTTLEELEPAMVIKYVITDDETGKKLFQAKSMQIRVDIETGETIYKASKTFLKKIEEFEE